MTIPGPPSRGTPASASGRAAGAGVPAAAAVLVAGIAGEITRIGLFFVPALAAMAVARGMLWREGPRP